MLTAPSRDTVRAASPSQDGPIMRIDPDDAAVEDRLRAALEQLEQGTTARDAYRAPEANWRHLAKRLIEMLLEDKQVLLWEASRQLSAGPAFNQAGAYVAAIRGVWSTGPIKPA
ncbi:MAG TPA: hypothetical protein VK963_02665 [Candidatus Saccharimonadales bacterium]|nr:hypothetical protein [Candidatus Saccharimonadales bacterium]